MKINKINDSVKLEMNNQFDAELQWYWCSCDCGVKAQRKDKTTIGELTAVLGKSSLANPDADGIAHGEEVCDLLDLTYCYCTGTKKTSGWL